jgi:hypothetical protein
LGGVGGGHGRRSGLLLVAPLLCCGSYGRLCCCGWCLLPAWRPWLRWCCSS